MTAVDWVIVAFTVLLAVYGYLQGFIVGALSLVGFAGGAFIGTRLGPLLLEQGDHSPYAPLFGLLGGLLLGGVLASGFEGVGSRVRSGLRTGGLRAADGLLGALLTACIGLGIAWIVGAVAAESSTSPRLRADVAGSTILTELDQILPPYGPVLNALAHLDPIPAVRGPEADVSPPTRHILATPGVQAAAHSVVRVFGTACGLGIEGSGWAIAPGLVVTNAHVVAGETDTEIQVGGVGRGLPGRVIAFDVHDDIALVRVAGLRLAPLSMNASARSGTPAAILGYPLDGSFAAEPARVGQTSVVSTQNAYGEGPVQRTITALRGLVRPGNSGGPLIDSRGRVIATVFAALTGSAHAGGFAVPDFVVRQVVRRDGRRQTAVATGHCAG